MTENTDTTDTKIKIGKNIALIYKNNCTLIGCSYNNNKFIVVSFEDCQNVYEFLLVKDDNKSIKYRKCDLESHKKITNESCQDENPLENEEYQDITTDYTIARDDCQKNNNLMDTFSNCKAFFEAIDEIAEEPIENFGMVGLLELLNFDGYGFYSPSAS